MMSSLESQFNPEDQAAALEFVLACVPMKRYGTNKEEEFLKTQRNQFITQDDTKKSFQNYLSLFRVN